MLPPTLHRYRASKHRLRRYGLPLIFLLLCSLPGVTCAQQVGEYHIKAVFLTNLIHFVTWPDSETSDQDDLFIIGILGPDPFQSILDKAIAGEIKNGRPLKIERYQSVDEVDPYRCAILFLHASQVEQWDRIRPRIADSPILTVADVSGFPERGGMVNLLKNGQKIEVEINHHAVQRSGLVMSSKLLSLARIVD